MKRWQVVVTTSAPLLFIPPSERVYSEHRWRWVARFKAFLWNTCPFPMVLSISKAAVRRKPAELRVVK